jgi:hypothetical protein
MEYVRRIGFTKQYRQYYLDQLKISLVRCIVFKSLLQNVTCVICLCEQSKSKLDGHSARKTGWQSTLPIYYQ